MESISNITNFNFTQSSLDNTRIISTISADSVMYMSRAKGDSTKRF